MMKGKNGHNQRELEKGFPAFSTASQTAFHHQLCFCSLNEQMEQIERVKLQQCADPTAAAVGDTLLHRDGGERGRGRRAIQSLVQPFI